MHEIFKISILLFHEFTRIILKYLSNLVDFLFSLAINKQRNTTNLKFESIALMQKRTQNTLFFDDNKVKMACKPGKKQEENTVGYTGEGKR